MPMPMNSPGRVSNTSTPSRAASAARKTYTYCQAVYLGACVELAELDGHSRWAERAAAVLDAISTRMAGPDDVLPGFDDGGDGGLFNGILARYLADAAVRRPELTSVAARLVLASAEATW